MAGVEGLTDPTAWKDKQLEAWYRQGLTGIVTIPPGESFLFRTGFTQAIDPDYICVLWDRSGMGAKQIVHRLAGVIDPDYTGEWFVRLVNHSSFLVTIWEGDKIVQGIYQERVEASCPLVASLPATSRGEKAFGSTDQPADSLDELAIELSSSSPQDIAVFVPDPAVVGLPSSDSVPPVAPIPVVYESMGTPPASSESPPVSSASSDSPSDAVAPSSDSSSDSVPAAPSDSDSSSDSTLAASSDSASSSDASVDSSSDSSSSATSSEVASVEPPPEPEPEPVTIEKVYAGSLVGQVAAALRDGQEDNAVAWMARDRRSFPAGVPSIVSGSMEIIPGRSAIKYHVLVG